MFGVFRRWRRRRTLRREFPGAWTEILRANVPLYSRLPEPQKSKVRQHVQVLLAEKRFEGCGGLEITDEIRVTIAGHAALLLLGRAEDYFPRLGSILVYPSAYKGRVEHHVGPGIVEEGSQGRLGESWTDGSVVLAWDAALHGATVLGDGQNVVLHEFAHQLDQEDRSADGTPYLGGRGRYVAWARVLGADFEQLREGRPGVLDSYGATNPAEFFAVATETFFEKPRQLKARNPELYEQLREYYGLDLAADAPP